MEKVVQALLPMIGEILGTLFKSGGAGFFGRFKEVGALFDVVKDVPERFAGNELMAELSKGLTSGDFAKDLSLDNLDAGSVLEKVGGLDDILKDAGEAGAPVKGFIFELAEKVAGASGSGLFGGGEKITATEEQFLTDLKGKLGL